MREIKFRAICKETKEIYEIEFLGDKVIKLRNGEWENRENFEIIQYTGLKDKNGKEIYEGDIVKLRGEEPYSSESITTDYDWEMEGDIIDQGGCYWIRAREDKSIWIPLFEYFIGDMELEVIGNIFENPELLKGESNV